jgi:hypothetical protein
MIRSPAQEIKLDSYVQIPNLYRFRELRRRLEEEEKGVDDEEK